MDNSAWIICLFILIGIVGTKCHTVVKRGFSSGSTAAGPAPQTCGTDNFYYRQDKKCKSRSQRCNGKNICINPLTMKEEDCSETSNPGEYYVFRGHAKLPGFTSIDNIIEKLEHPFITFRGLTYEYGKFYQVQVLDIADPIYKYRNGKHLNDRGIEQIGRSYCTQKDANKVVGMWKDEKYKFITNNCHHFADALSDILIHGSCNQPPASRSKRQDDDLEFSRFIDAQLRNCSLVCCYDVSSASTAPLHNLFLAMILIFVIITILINFGFAFL